jgi:hypothetical protein
MQFPAIDNIQKSREILWPRDILEDIAQLKPLIHSSTARVDLLESIPCLITHTGALSTFAPIINQL